MMSNGVPASQHWNYSFGNDWERPAGARRMSYCFSVCRAAVSRANDFRRQTDRAISWKAT
jgi:hypothetical protein